MDNDKILGCLGAITLGIAAQVLGALLNGWVLSILWGWFFVPLGIQPIRVIHAIGIGTTVSLLTSSAPRGKDEREAKEKMASSIAFLFVVPLVCIVIGWIVHSFM
jgi:hypothetical protein